MNMSKKTRTRFIALLATITGFGILPSLAGAASYTSTSPYAASIVASSPVLQAAIAERPGGMLSAAPMTLYSSTVGPQNIVYGNCGSAWLYDTTGSSAGTIDEAAGMNLNYIIAWGSGSIFWYNGNTYKSNTWYFTIAPNLSGNWYTVHVATTGSGYIGSDLKAVAVTPFGNCYTPSGGIYSSAYAK